ncbi:hypothetical protein PRZ48_009277 [Zasmidium cellare]|uniref:EthD domain-containing protein n=1 Tax=Zasmidium cellare TaxID=395010 RepID=A0ABR0EBA5_ZASCE|nr:hypothetical protein PRZ48_009277 [Zasmidium cellare]
MSSPIKQFVVLRRRAGQTIKAFHNYHYQQHGSVSQAPNPEETPLVYYQTHFFDSVYSSTELAQPWYTGHNDSTELYFANPEHMGRVFSSAHVREKVGPDGHNFNDFAAAIAMSASENTVYDAESDPKPSADRQSTTATYWLQTTGEDVQAAATTLDDLIKTAFQPLATKIVSNVALPDPDGMLKYFQGKTAPLYSAAYQVYLPDATSVDKFEEARRGLVICGMQRPPKATLQFIY